MILSTTMMHSVQNRIKKAGFTIVELIVVIVVIGILAGISIVAYNGIQNRAREASLASTLQSANKLITIYYARNNTYPPTVADIGLSDTGGATILYTANNDTSPKTFFMSASLGTSMLFVSSSVASPTTIANTPSSGSTTLLASGDNPPGETKQKLFDNSANTKWLTFSPVGWVMFSVSTPILATGYSITSANDGPDRDPKNWTLEGSNDRNTWAVIDTQTGQTFASRYLKRDFTISGNTMPYKHYRFNVTLNNGASIVQAAELTIMSSGGAATVLTQ